MPSKSKSEQEDASIVYSDTELIKIVGLDFNSANPQNIIVFDKTGDIKYSNISKDEIFSAMRNLITR